MYDQNRTFGKKDGEFRSSIVWFSVVNLVKMVIKMVRDEKLATSENTVR